ncbi:MAG: alpha/beta fold hydrolase, partial [Burkholderiales bacterium]|nr:alpha/beta fold hydrolase [Burkholderiales bacterium]
MLHVERHGSAAPLLLIHGWGMHGGMWGGVAEKLAQHFNVYAVDLPGHGYSKEKNVGWVERSDTHHVQNVNGDGYRCAPPPTRYCAAADCGRRRKTTFPPRMLRNAVSCRQPILLLDEIVD